MNFRCLTTAALLALLYPSAVLLGIPFEDNNDPSCELPPSPTIEAKFVPSSGPESCPPGAANDGEFELAGVRRNEQFENPNYAPWGFEPGTGLAGDASSIGQWNGPPPSGKWVAWIDAGKEVSVDLPTGAWKVTYSAARAQPHVNSPEQLILDVTVAGHSVSYTEDRDLTNVWSYTEFETRPFYVDGSAPLTFSVTSAGPFRALLDHVQIESLNEWGDTASWMGGVLPTDQDHVLIPDGVSLHFQGALTTKSLRVEGALTAIGDTTLTTDWMAVKGAGGRLEIGLPEAPFPWNFELVLAGLLTDPSIYNAGSKFLMAMDEGTIEMHGLHKQSWTHLVATGLVADMTIEVKDAEQWQPGDQIFLTGSEGQDAVFGFHYDFSETFSIHAISEILDGNGDVGSYLIDLGTFEDPTVIDQLSELHHGGASSMWAVGDKNLLLDQRAEVGVFTRNIVVRGTEEEIVDPADGGLNTGFGGHIMIMEGTCCAGAGVGRFSNVELTGLGQSRIVGRYPIHWHMVRDSGAGQYIRNSSIHHSFNRAITIHGTDELEVIDNTAYRTLGHAVFLEDGSEQDNIIRGNLVTATLRPEPGDETIPSDNSINDFQNRTPGAFWITNPRNTIEDNVASDTTGTGFWFVFPRQVLGLSAEVGHNAGDAPSLLDPLIDEASGEALIRRNVAHGCANGVDIHDGIHPEDSPTNPTIKKDDIRKSEPWNPPSSLAILSDFTIYSCDAAIYAGIGPAIVPGTVEFRRFRFADNSVGALFASYDTVADSVFVADTQNDFYTSLPNLGSPGLQSYEAYRIYDGAGGITNCRFDGYIGLYRTLIGFNSAAERHPHHRFSGVTLTDSVSGGNATTPQVEWFDFECSILNQPNCPELPDGQAPATFANNWGLVATDLDGSLFGAAGASLISNAPLMRVAEHEASGADTPWANPVFLAFDPAFPGTAYQTQRPSHAYLTQRSYGFLKVRMNAASEAALSSPTPPAAYTTPPIQYRRISDGLDPVFDSTPAIAAPFHQLPVILGEPFEAGCPTPRRYIYVVNALPWAMPGAQHPLTADANLVEIELFLEDADLDTITVLEVKSVEAYVPSGGSIDVTFNGGLLTELVPMATNNPVTIDKIEAGEVTSTT